MISIFTTVKVAIPAIWTVFTYNVATVDIYPNSTVLIRPFAPPSI